MRQHTLTARIFNRFLILQGLPIVGEQFLNPAVGVGR